METAMTDADDQAARDTRTFLPMLAGAALLFAAAVMTGPLAVALGVIGGTMLGFSALTPFLPRTATDAPEFTCPPDDSSIETTAEASATSIADSQQPVGQWIQRTTANASTAKRHAGTSTGTVSSPSRG